jgi:hypothetical protein
VKPDDLSVEPPTSSSSSWANRNSLSQLINVLRGDLTIVGTGRRWRDFGD